jgi:hypothetical protein
VHGSLVADPSSDTPPLQTGVYNIQSREAVPFNPLNVPQMTESAIDAVLAAGSVAETLVVSVSGSLHRLVVSKAVITNPVDPPANWQITSRGESLVGTLLPQASVDPRDYFFMILPPGHQENVLGSCEGVAFAPAPVVGFARLFYDAPGNIWKLLLHAGTVASDGVTYKGTWAGAAATIPTNCLPLDVEILTPTIDFGNVEEGMVMYREIVLLNRSAGPVTITLPALVAPFGIPDIDNVNIPADSTGTLLVSFTAGAAGPAITTPITLSANPMVGGSLDVTLTGTPVGLSTVDIALVLDRSYSMSEPALTGFRVVSKAEVRNEAAQVLVDLLRDGDRIGLVRFNQDAQPHMPLTIAGPVGGTGKADAAAALADVNLNPAGATSVGDGMDQANTMLTPPSAATRKAMLILTDGVENSSLFISAVALSPDIRAYAVGFGLPQNVNVDKLSAVTGNTGGYLLITGELTQENEFRLHKYFAQILAGISADSIVVDPRMEIGPGQTQRIPFYIGEADSRFDAVLLTRFPVLRFGLEAPDGTRIDAGNVVGFNGQFVQGRQCRYYRMALPVFAGTFSRNLGKWHIVVHHPGRRVLDHASLLKTRMAAARKNDKRRLTTEFNSRHGYNVLVRARSSIQMDAGIVQSGFGPASERTLVAHMTAFGLPLRQKVHLLAEITRPDGIVTVQPLVHAGNGRFEAKLDDTKRHGTYQIVVRAAGETPGKWPLQREQTLSGVVVDPTAQNEADVKTDELRDVLKDILKTQDERLRNVESLLDQLVQQARSAATQGFPSWFLWAVLLFILILLIIVWTLAGQ